MTKSLVFELLRSSDEASYTYNSKQHGGCPSDILSSILMPTNKNFRKPGPSAQELTFYLLDNVLGGGAHQCGN